MGEDGLGRFSDALVVPSEAGGTRIPLEISTAGQVASANTALGSQALGNARDAVQMSPACSVGLDAPSDAH